MDERIRLESGKYVMTRHMITVIVNRTNKTLCLDFYKGQLTIEELEIVTIAIHKEGHDRE